MRSGSPVRAGTFAYMGNGLVTGWHAHDLHQIEYAFQGTVEVDAGRSLPAPASAGRMDPGRPHASDDDQDHG